MELRELDFGAAAAESDDRLSEYFIDTPVAESIALDRIGLVVGRKGSGKTAIFREFDGVLQRHGLSAISTLRLDLDDHAWRAFSDFEKLGLSTEHAATVSWELAILLQVAAMVGDADRTGWSRKAFDASVALKRFVQENFGEVNPQLSDSSALIGNLQSLSLSAFGAGVAFETDGAEPDIAPAVVDLLADTVRPALDVMPCMVLLDQLDDSWDGTERQRSLLVGLLKAVKRINDRFGWSRDDDALRGLRVVAFLRTDIHEALSFDDKDKHRDSLIEITWTHERLAELIQQRLPEGVELDAIFESQTSQRKGRMAKGSFNYLVSRTFMRPRDLISFLSTIRSTGLDTTVIDKQLVEAAESRYSREKVDDLRQEYRRGAPWIDPTLDALRQGPNKFDSRSDLEMRVSRVFTADSDYLVSTPAELVDWMVDISIVGTAPRAKATETIRFACEGDPVALTDDRAAWIHPALFRGLALTEPRDRRG